MKLGSLFDGSGGFPLAGVLHGIEPVWASEIEPFPIRVTKTRFPNMKHLGSVTDVNGAEVEPVDIITFGSPCQDLSVAGKQLGIHDGQRSNLFFEAIRIIKEMRNATADNFPRFAVWENVPGAFSSNKGKDFQAVLQAFCEIGGATGDIVPMPPKNKWLPAGCIMGNGWSVAWRIYDAQFWGVPQRRKRIYLIADFESERAGEILFERDGLRWDSAPCGTEREGTAGDAEGSAGGSDSVKCLTPWDCQSKRQYSIDGAYCTLNAGASQSGQAHGVCYAAAFMGGQGAKARSIAYCDDGSTPTLKSAQSGGNTVPDVVYAVEGNTVDRDAKQNGCGYCESVCPSLNTQDKHAVCYPDVARSLLARHDSSPCADRGQNVVCYGVDCRNVKIEREKTHTIQAKANGGISLNCTPSVCYRKAAKPRSRSDGEKWIEDTVTNTLNTFENSDIRTTEAVVYPKVTGAFCAKMNRCLCGQDAFNDTVPVIKTDKPPRKYIVRRLTPLECCRLQGFPDWWTDGVDGSDSARYKLWGNGIALPCAEDVIGRCARALREE